MEDTGVYSEPEREELIEDDEISVEELFFMEGYDSSF